MDKFDVLGPLFAAIGELSAAIVGHDPHGLYLYAEAKEHCIGDGIFIEEGDAVRYYEPSAELCDLLHQAREAEGDDQWAVMQYKIADDTFDAELVYPEDIDPELSPSERRSLFLRQRFGNKPLNLSDGWRCHKPPVMRRPAQSAVFSTTRKL